jgi:hypothetical protein
LKNKRRIEITAFRRTITTSTGWPVDEATHDPDSGPDSADDPPAQLNQAVLVEGVLSRIDAGSPELEHLIEALIASNGDSEPAAEQARLGPNKNLLDSAVIWSADHQATRDAGRAGQS